jgi:hypothetical protein
MSWTKRAQSEAPASEVGGLVPGVRRSSIVDDHAVLSTTFIHPFSQPGCLGISIMEPV